MDPPAPPPQQETIEQSVVRLFELRNADVAHAQQQIGTLASKLDAILLGLPNHQAPANQSAPSGSNQKDDENRGAVFRNIAAMEPMLKDFGSFRPRRFTKELPEYKGGKEDVDRWFNNLEITFESYNMEDHGHLKYQQTYPLLADNAQVWWHTQGKKQLEDDLNEDLRAGNELDVWATFKAILYKRFSNVRNLQEAVDKLYKLQQASNEPCDELFDRFDYLIQVAELPTNCWQRKHFLYTALHYLIRERVPNHLWNDNAVDIPEIKEAIYVAERQAIDRGDLRYHNNRSYTSSDSAVDMDLSVRSVNPRKLASRKPFQPKPRTKLAASTPSGSNAVSRPKVKPEKTYKCWNCDREGDHYFRDCPKPLRSKPSPKSKSPVDAKGKGPRLHQMSDNNAAAKPSTYKAAVNNAAGAGPSSF